MGELTRTPLSRHQHGDADIVVWTGIGRVDQHGEELIVRNFSVTVDGADVPVELDGDEGEGELVAKVRQWLDAQAER